MPKAASINPILVRTLFDYDPSTGNLIPKPTAAKAARRTNSRQWEIGDTEYSVHRLVWAWHNPDNPDPKYIRFRNGDKRDWRIENLEARDVHPRWEGHAKKTAVRLDSYGRVVDADSPDLPPPDVPVRPRASELLNPKPVTPTSPTFDPEEFEAMADELARTIPQAKPTPARLTPTPPPVRPNTAAMYDPDFDPWEGMYE